MEIKLLDKDTNINKLHLNFCKEIIMNNETYKLLESIFYQEFKNKLQIMFDTH